MVLGPLSFLARLGAIAASVIVLGLNAVFIENKSWLTGVLIYIEIIAAVSVVAALIPPYPNFFYDFIFFIALILAAVFALVVQVFESPCYGFRIDTRLNCSAYKAGTAFVFIAAFAWAASAVLGALRIVAVIFNFKGVQSRTTYIGGDKGPAVDEQGPRSKKVKGFLNTSIAKYFLCYGIAAVVLLATVLPIIFVYAAPAFGQYLLAGVPLPSVNISLYNPTNSTIKFDVLSNITVPDKFKIELHSTNISFYQVTDTERGEYPFAIVDLPDTAWNSQEKVTVENQTLELQNLTEFTKLIQQVAYYPTFKVAGAARAKVHVGPINTWVNLYKEVELTAFDNFTGFDITEIGVQSPDANGNDVYGQVNVYNPSPASVTLGEVTLAILIGDVAVGQASTMVDNIVPGNNTFNVTGKLNATAVSNYSYSILATELPYLKEESVIATAKGLSVVYDGQHLPYWEQAFGLIRITATKPVIPLLNELVNSTADRLFNGTGGIVSPVLTLLLDLVVENLKGLPDQTDAGLEKVASSLVPLLLKLFQGLGLI